MKYKMSIPCKTWFDQTLVEILAFKFKSNRLITLVYILNC